jgi:hypothetical protein
MVKIMKGFAPLLWFWGGRLFLFLSNTFILQQIAKMLSALTKKDRFSLFSSSSTHKSKFIIRLSQMFSI